jgi:DNA-binding response OmpR family regulator
MKKVLIVDDNNEILDIISIVLDMEGYSVECSNSGHRILDKVLRYSPDLILLDIMLGDLDGREICKELKGNFDTKHIPVIMISASHHLYNNNVKVCDADDFIAKPFDIDDLVARVAHNVQ